MSPLAAIYYSFLFGLLHGILPDEHTWPITFSYAVGSGSSKAGLKAGLYFSAAFTIQRAIFSELSYLALAPLFLSKTFNIVIYLVVGIVMAIAGYLILRKNKYYHVHIIGHHHDDCCEMETSGTVLTKHHEHQTAQYAAPPVKWTLIHGFIAGFGIGGFSLFILTVAAPAMGTPWLGFLPGLIYGIGTMIVLAVFGTLFANLLKLNRSISQDDIKKIGSQTGGRTLFFGGILFAVFALGLIWGFDKYVPIESGSLLILLFILIVALPSFIISYREVRS